MKKSFVNIFLLISITYLLIYVLAISNIYVKPAFLIDHCISISLVMVFIVIRWEWEIRGCFDSKKLIQLRKGIFYIFILVQVYNFCQYYIKNKNYLQFLLLYYGFISFMALIIFFCYGFGMRRDKWRINMFVRERKE